MLQVQEAIAVYVDHVLTQNMIYCTLWVNCVCVPGLEDVPHGGDVALLQTHGRLEALRRPLSCHTPPTHIQATRLLDCQFRKNELREDRGHYLFHMTIRPFPRYTQRWRRDSPTFTPSLMVSKLTRYTTSPTTALALSGSFTTCPWTQSR